MTGSADRCFFHGVEPVPNDCYRVCGECGHAFVTAEALLQAEHDVVEEINRASLTDWRAVPSENADDIHFCPLCTHDW